MSDFLTNRSRESKSVAVIVASIGRPDNIATLLAHLSRQSQVADHIILSVVSDSDLPPDAIEFPNVTIVTGPRGLPAQRNTGLTHLPKNVDVVVFFDDDYIPSHYCIERIAHFFAAHPQVGGANGYLIADGINSGGIATADAEAMILEYDASAGQPSSAIERKLTGLYGCNMAYRTASIAALRFDERLKLYGWQEDIDFATQVAAHGLIVKTSAFAGVHQGVKGGRTSGMRLGYSQVINPLYLIKKGTMPGKFGLALIARNVLANHLGMFRPEPWVDRIGRARGNWMGIADAIRGRLTPERIESL